ncbi:MAG TPA: TldD/PmbA family protein [Firmicutes bacterium]|nr:TldD/PmbA family protein [Bacillota bacterium]
MEEILREALKESDAAEVFAIDRAVEPVNFEANRLKSVEGKEIRGIALRIIRGGRLGFAATSYLDGGEDLVFGRSKDLARELIRDAVESSEYGPPARWDFAGNSSPGRAPEVYDARVAGLSPGDLVAIGYEMIKIVRAEFPLAKCDGDFARELVEVSLVNSSGLATSYRKTGIAGGLEVTLASEGDILSVYDFGQSCRHDIDFEAMTHGIVEKIRISQKISNIRTGRFPVVFTPRAVVFLLDSVKPAFNGKVVFQGASPLRDKLGAQVFDPRLALYDDGAIDFGPNSYAFDDEGVPTGRTPLVERGVVKNFIYDLKTAGLAGSRSTGNGFRISRAGEWTFESQPSPSSTNLVMEPGDMSIEEMISGIEEGLLVDQVLGAGQGNVLSGAFSMNVHLGFKIAKGKLEGRVKNTMVSGNILESLREIGGIGNRAEWVLGPYKVPALLLPSLGIASLNGDD